MFEGQYLFAGDTTVVYSPWFSRQADNAIFSVDLMLTNTATLEVLLYTKNSEDPGDGAVVSGANGTILSATSSANVYSHRVTGGMEEMVRYQFTVSSGTSDPTHWVFFRMLPPSWFDTVKA